MNSCIPVTVRTYNVWWIQYTYMYCTCICVYMYMYKHYTDNKLICKHHGWVTIVRCMIIINSCLRIIQYMYTRVHEACHQQCVVYKNNINLVSWVVKWIPNTQHDIVITDKIIVLILINVWVLMGWNCVQCFKSQWDY